MSVSTTTSTSANTAANTAATPTAGQVARGRWQTWRWVLLVAIVVALAALVTVIFGPQGASARLSPTNPAPDGSRALVQVLRRHGVLVQERRDSRRVVASTTARSTLVVTSPELLAPEQLDRLAADDVTNLVLIEPDELALSKLAPGLHTAGQSDRRVTDPECDVPAARTAGAARSGGFDYTSEIPGTVCYPSSVSSGPAAGAYAVEQDANRKIIVFGQSDVLTNEYLGRDGNAALALTTLGEQPRLIWYTPNPLEPTGVGQRPTLTELLPDWVAWVVIQLIAVLVVVMIWRSRRLGRLVSEPLPVLVRAAETQEGRARLYRQARARGRAAATLRTTTLRRLAGRLTAPSGTTPEQLVTLVAAAAGRDEAALRALLLGPAPTSDAALVALADDLDAVEHDLTRTIDPKGTPL
jgi:hypothetical protein